MKLTIEQRKHIEGICERIMKSDFGDEFDFHYFRLCDYIESQYATQRTAEVGEGWISVEEQPEKGEWYLVHIDRMGCGRPNIIDVCMYDSPQVWLRVDGDIPNDWKVTHWQPLPEPPKNSEDGK